MKQTALQIAVKYLEENHNETIELQELYDEMRKVNNLETDQLYTSKQMGAQLEAHFNYEVANS